MELLLVILFIVAAWICAIKIADVLVEYYSGIDKQCPKIKFEAFKKFYSINPDRWNLDIHSVVCKIEREDKGAYGRLFYGYDNERFYFTFLII